MSLRVFMIQEAIVCLEDAAEYFQSDSVHMFEQCDAVSKVVDELRKELLKKDESESKRQANRRNRRG